MSRHIKGKETQVEGDLIMKARNVLNGNRDRDGFTVRSDSYSADLAVVRIVISIGLTLEFVFGTADMKGAYITSGPSWREIYARPPNELRAR